MNDICLEIYRKVEHLKARFHPSQYKDAGLLDRLACLDLAEHLIREHGLYNEYQKMLDTMADLYQADYGVKQ